MPGKGPKWNAAEKHFMGLADDLRRDVSRYKDIASNVQKDAARKIVKAENAKHEAEETSRLLMHALKIAGEKYGFDPTELFSDAEQSKKVAEQYKEETAKPDPAMSTLRALFRAAYGMGVYR